MRRGAVVLCGGHSTRVGRDKATLPLGGEDLLARAVRLLANAAEEVVVVARPGQELPTLPSFVRVVRDEVPERGPLGGLLSGLRATHAEAVYVTGCDAPFLVPGFVDLLFSRLGDADAAVPQANGRLHPLPAVYRPRIAPLVESLLAEGPFGPKTLLERVRTVSVSEPDLRAADPDLSSLEDPDLDAPHEAVVRSVPEGTTTPPLRGTTIVVPCFDEEKRLRPQAFLDHVAATEDRFLFVDDGSRDGTRRVLEAARGARPDRVDVLALAENRGKAEAVRQGMLRAFAGNTPTVAFFDADLATPLSAIAELRSALEERPGRLAAIGSRVQMLGRAVHRLPLRHYLGRFLATGISLSLGVPVYDTQCGAKVFRSCEETAALFREPFLTNWLFDVEILARMIREHRQGRARPVEETVVEVPLREWNHVEGSKVKARDFFVAWVEIARIRRKVLR